MPKGVRVRVPPDAPWRGAVMVAGLSRKQMGSQALAGSSPVLAATLALFDLSLLLLQQRKLETGLLKEGGRR